MIMDHGNHEMQHQKGVHYEKLYIYQQFKSKYQQRRAFKEKLIYKSS